MSEKQKANSKCLFHKVLKALARWIHIKDNEPWYICYKAKQLIWHPHEVTAVFATAADEVMRCVC